MPVVVYTVEEVADSLIRRSRDLSKEIVDQSDLKAKPLAPGESPDARRHKLAKLGKQLAELFQQLDALMNVAANKIIDEHNAASVEPGSDTSKEAN